MPYPGTAWSTGISRPSRLSCRSTSRRSPSRQVPARFICCWINSQLAFSRPCGEELFAVAHLEAPLHAEPLAVGVGFQDQERRVGRDDVVLFAKGR